MNVGMGDGRGVDASIYIYSCSEMTKKETDEAMLDAEFLRIWD